MTSVTLIKPKQEIVNRPAPPLKHRARRRWPLALAISLIVLSGGWFYWQGTHPTGNGTSGLITETVQRGDLIETISATGSVTAQTGAQVKIGSQITGRIKKLNADVGSQVKAGQIIAELDLPDVQAQLNQAKANLAAARIKLAQQLSGVGMQQMQTNTAVLQADAGRLSMVARLHAAIAAQNLQLAQTPIDIRRAENGLIGTKAALLTAQSDLVQTKAGTDLLVANAQAQIDQTKATAVNSDIDLQRQQTLLKRGFVATGIVDQAQATATVNRSLVRTAEQALVLVKQKNAADLETGRNLVTQAKQNVRTAQASLAAANAETLIEDEKAAEVGDAKALLSEAQANLVVAKANIAQNVLKQQDVGQAKEAVKALQEQVIYAQAQMAKTFIRSPISGTVLQLAAQQGETLAAGLSSPTLIVVADLNRLQVDTYVDETDIGKVRIGQSVTATVDAFPANRFIGRVTKIASGSTIQVGVITYDVTVALESAEKQLKPDMTASVTIQTGKRTDVVLIPSEAVKTGTKGTTVNVLTKGKGTSATESRKVTVGGTDGVRTEILTGLKEGETVILAGALKTTDAKKSNGMFGGARGGGSRSGGGGPPP